jgi:iron-regulated transporter 1
MTTYLLSVHYTLPHITAARTLSSAVELSSTVLMPLAISFLSRSSNDPLVPLSRVGLWSLSWQFLTLLPVVVSLLLLPTSSPNPASSYPVLTVLLFVCLALSRLGFWTYSLVVQNLVQIVVPATQRSEFSGMEMGFMSAAEIGRWGATGIWSRPEQFKGVAWAGMATVTICMGMYLKWVWVRRGNPRGSRS